MPRGLYFSKALFEGLIFGGACPRREICVSKSIGPQAAQTHVTRKECKVIYLTEPARVFGYTVYWGI